MTIILAPALAMTKTTTLFLALLAVLASLSLEPVQAQSTGNSSPSSSPSSSSNYLTSALGSLLPRLGSSGGGIFPFASGYIPYAAPGYLPFGLRNMLYRPSNYRPNSFTNPGTQQSVGYASTNSSSSDKALSAQSYYDSEPLLGPRQRIRPLRNQTQATDQIAHAGWSQAQPLSGVNASQSSLPSRAPEHARSAQAPALSAGPEPTIIDAFIQRVNSRFDGDIGKALFDPQTRGLAKSIGLTDEDALFDANLSQSRTSIVRNILKDASMSSLSKINAVKIILHDKSN